MKIDKKQALVILEGLKKLLSKKEYKRIEKRIIRGLFYEKEFHLSIEDEETVSSFLFHMMGITNTKFDLSESCVFKRGLLDSDNLKYGVICFVRNTPEENYRVRFSDGIGGFTDRFNKPCKTNWKMVEPIYNYAGVKTLVHFPSLGCK